ncbi:hypothetical protein MASR2M17_13720 [Aminivibrio sp.]
MLHDDYGKGKLPGNSDRMLWSALGPPVEAAWRQSPGGPAFSPPKEEGWKGGDFWGPGGVSSFSRRKTRAMLAPVTFS